MVSEGYTLDDINQGIWTEFEQYFEDIAFDGSTAYMSYHKAIEMVFRVPGVLDIVDLLLNGQKDTVPIAYEEFCKLQEVVFSAN